MRENESSQDHPPLRDSPLRELLANFSLLDALRQRRSRRFGLGMKIPAGPLAYASKHRSRPLTEDEEAALVFAACGITGHALADLCYAKGEGGGIMAGLVARTIASGDGLQTVALIVINDGGAWLVRRPREMPAGDISKLIELGQRGEFTELYRRCRVKIAGERPKTPAEPLFNINANRWSAHAPGSTIFLPLNDLTFMYVNGLLEILNPETGAFILDERNHFLPAGLGKFARSRGGHLEDDPRQGRVATVRQVEQFVAEFVTVEQGMMLQNLGLMAQALGLGGYPEFCQSRVCVVSITRFPYAPNARQPVCRRRLAGIAGHEMLETQSADSLSRGARTRRRSTVEALLSALPPFNDRGRARGGGDKIWSERYFPQ